MPQYFNNQARAKIYKQNASIIKNYIKMYIKRSSSAVINKSVQNQFCISSITWEQKLYKNRSLQERFCNNTRTEHEQRPTRKFLNNSLTKQEQIYTKEVLRYFNN